MGNPQLKGSIFFFQRSRRKHHAERLEGDSLLEICNLTQMTFPSGNVYRSMTYQSGHRSHPSCVNGDN